MSWSIRFAKAAEREFKNLTKRDRELAAELLGVIFALESNPRPPNHKKLSGEEALYRIRMKDYRIIYQIQDDRLVILVLRVAHRREVYKKRT